MRRRDVITLLGGAAMAWPAVARAQQPAMPVIGFLRDTNPEGGQSFVAALRNGLREAGFREGQNLTIEYRWTNGQTDRLPELAADLVRRRVSVIVASAINPALAAKAATATIPIVFAIANDPIEFKLVASFNRPGGNVTGVSYVSAELGGKRLGLLHELVPKVTDVAVLANPTNPNTDIFTADVEAAARTVGVRSKVFNVGSEAEIETVFAALAGQRMGALLVATDALFTTQRLRIVALAARHRIPAVYTAREYAELGGLMSYGPSLPEVYRLAGAYTGRILRGEKPADLPVLLPTTYEMIINLKTAAALGLDVAPTLVARADEVIE